jgi:DNA uptake protein ComE-like DNA-binding protein
MSWKDYFYFTKSQRIGLITLILFFVVLWFVKYLFIPRFITKDCDEPIDTTFIQQVQLFKASLKETVRPTYPKNYAKHKSYSKEYPKKSFEKKTTFELFQFNPNELDSVGFIRLGLKPFMAHNILKYRAKGGKYKTVEQFGKLYGLSSEEFERLKPYIIIPIEEKPTIETAQISPVEINGADTTALVDLKMPLWMAKKIIFYRKQLGGYISVLQLKEVKNIPPDLIDRIAPYIEIDQTKIQKIAVNRASIDRMRAHPYINFYQANDIYEYRRNHGKYNSIEDLKKIESKDITDDFLKKVEPYFDFSIK